MQGYGGSIEVLTGMESGGILRGISVGGPDFKETEGLGARRRSRSLPISLPEKHRR